MPLGHAGHVPPPARRSVDASLLHWLRQPPGAREAIQIVFDPAVLSYRAVLEHFFQVHEHHNLRAAGEPLWAELPFCHLLHGRAAEGDGPRDDRGDRSLWWWPGPVVTEIKPGERFWQPGARAPGIPATAPGRLQLPLHLAELAAAVGSCIPEVTKRRGARTDPPANVDDEPGRDSLLG
jgi:hypothetical protein